MSSNFFGLARERALELLQRGQQRVRRLVERGEVHGAREHVVGRLAHVHVVVGVDASSPASVAMTSLAFMFDEVPEPVWKTSIGNWSSCSPAATASAAVAIALGDRGVELPELRVRARGGALDAPEPVDDRLRDGLAGDREVVDGLLGLAAVERLLRCHARAGYCGRYPQNAASSRATPTGSSYAIRNPVPVSTRSCASGSRSSASSAACERVQRVLVGPQQQRRRGDPRVRVEQLAARADRAARARTSPTSGRGSRCRRRRRTRGGRGRAPPGSRAR